MVSHMAKPTDSFRGEVAVLGSGVMGAAIAAHLANAGVPVLLLDVVPKDAPAGDKAARNRVAREGLERARKSKPASFFSPRFETLVTVGNLEDDLEAASRRDVTIEAIIENLEIKRALYKRLESFGGNAVVTSNTSGLRIRDLMAELSPDFRRRFCITHFFNWWRSWPTPTRRPRRCPAPRRSAVGSSARGSCAPRTRPTSSPTGSAPSRSCAPWSSR
jgi:choline dehydrogenase-like flavoprotein